MFLYKVFNQNKRSIRGCMNTVRVIISFVATVVLVTVAFYVSSCAYHDSRLRRFFDHPAVEEEVFLPPLDPFVKPTLTTRIDRYADIPVSHFYPPTPPVGGIYSVLEGITDEEVGQARVLAYMLTYYPLVGLEDEFVSQLNNRQRAEYKRQNDALDKEIFGSDYTLIKRVGSVLRVPIAVLNILRQE